MIVLFLLFISSTWSYKNTHRNTQWYTSLDQSPSSFFIEEIEAVKDYLDIVMYKFSDSDIRDAIIASLERGVEVRMLIDKSTEKDIIDECEKYGAKVRYWDYKERKTLHAKMVVFDREMCSIGSPNFSNDATDENMELWIVLNSDECIDVFEDLWKVSFDL